MGERGVLENNLGIGPDFSNAEAFGQPLFPQKREKEEDFIRPGSFIPG